MADTGRTVEEQWLLSNAVGGGEARRMAVASAKQKGLVPWAGVAARLRASMLPAATAQAPGTSPLQVASSSAHLKGRAYCFLPLPIATELPVHVNGFFEVSSNRRQVIYSIACYWGDATGIE